MSAGSTHTLGLRADGTVVSAGNNADRQCDVESWSGIRAAE
ncbi:MAG: RCC1 domain-containing protein [Actinomycetia bacterium]|nr:RCC1 domain-containing protein [Actinomycetes bacterium]